MVVAVISRAIHKIIEALDQNEEIYLIKQKGPKAFFYVKADLTNTNVVSYTKSAIRKNLENVYVYEVYGMYNGMVDLFDYFSEEKKQKEKYYNGLKKDLSDEELESWKQSQGL